jgi:hypothetical protein
LVEKLIEDQNGDGKMNIKVGISEIGCKDGRWMNWLRIMSSITVWY